uniref:Expressed protein n=1 Tax=Echinococcus granulosus TaxID=6210 RepID=A0A068WF04_ECHGR|nr:expressed protein [Echinococcus granulosus]
MSFFHDLINALSFICVSPVPTNHIYLRNKKYTNSTFSRIQEGWKKRSLRSWAVGLPTTCTSNSLWAV